MKNTNLAIRTAVATALNAGGGIIHSGTQKIASFEEYLQETDTRKKAILTVGNLSLEAYIILLNQTQNEGIGSKCGRNDECSIQLQVTTVYPSGKGGSKIAEEISDLALARLASVALPDPFGLWKYDTVGIRNLNYDAQSTRTWIVQITLNFSVTQ